MATIKETFVLTDQASSGFRNITKAAGTTTQALERMGRTADQATTQASNSTKRMNTEIKKASTSINIFN